MRVDDLPYLVAISRDCPVDLEHEYRGILDMFEDPSGETATAPLRAFFGEMTAKPRRRKSYPLALLNNKVNLDQLLAINNAMRYPLAYVQGPPGTGKTNTIVNTLTTAFFNERTVLFFQLQQPSHRRRCGKAAGRHLPRPDRAVPDPAPWQQRENRRGPAHHRPAV